MQRVDEMARGAGGGPTRPAGQRVDEEGPRGNGRCNQKARWAGGGQGPLGGLLTRRAAGRAAEDKASNIDCHAPGGGQQPSRVVPLPSFPPGRLFI